MSTISATRLGLFAALLLLMVSTRINHFAPIPDASWAVFFAAGFYLGAAWRWAFPALMVAAVAVDYAVISGSGGDFWAHYCVSPGYWFLLPAYFSLWMGGAWLASERQQLLARRLAGLVLAVLAAVALCHLWAQGGFYWLSDSVTAPSLAGWWKNYSDWLLPYLQTTALYLGPIVLLQALAEFTQRRAGSVARVRG